MVEAPATQTCGAHTLPTDCASRGVTDDICANGTFVILIARRPIAYTAQKFSTLSDTFKHGLCYAANVLSLRAIGQFALSIIPLLSYEQICYSVYMDESGGFYSSDAEGIVRSRTDPQKLLLREDNNAHIAGLTRL